MKERESDVVIDQFSQRRGLVGAGLEQTAYPVTMQQAATAVSREGIGELRVPFASEKGEGRDQRSGADAGYDLEIGPLTPTAESNQCAGAKGAHRAAAGQRQDIYPPVGRCASNALERLRDAPVECVPVGGVVANVGREAGRVRIPAIVTGCSGRT